MRPRFIAALLGFFTILAPWEPAHAQTMETEAALAARWETSRHDFSWPRNCSPVDRSRIAPVSPRARAEAYLRLANEPAIELSEAELNHFLSPDVAQALFANMDGALRPFLVRAVAKNDVPVFLAYVCDDLLVVQHGSLGRSTPPSRRAPLVILLDRLPAHTAVLWSIAE